MGYRSHRAATAESQLDPDGRLWMVVRCRGGSSFSVRGEGLKFEEKKILSRIEGPAPGEMFYFQTFCHAIYAYWALFLTFFLVYMGKTKNWGKFVASKMAVR